MRCSNLRGHLPGKIVRWRISTIVTASFGILAVEIGCAGKYTNELGRTHMTAARKCFLIAAALAAMIAGSAYAAQYLEPSNAQR